MISIFWYSICNFIAGFSPTFVFLLIFRTLLGIGMGAESPARAASAMETWPQRLRGLMSAVLQGSWSIGFLLSSVIYGLFFDTIGWRGWTARHHRAPVGDDHSRRDLDRAALSIHRQRILDHRRFWSARRLWLRSLQPAPELPRGTVPD